MSKSGHNNWDGINYQTWVSLSLFLQYLKDQNFLHIQLEGENLEDFTLYFKDGSKTICEAKVRKAGVGYPVVKGILNNIVARKTFMPEDRILLVCTKISEGLVEDIKSVKYFPQTREKLEKIKKFTKAEIDLFEHIDFWIVDEKFNKIASQALLADLVGAWLPEKEIELMVNSLTEKFRAKSAKGEIYSREDIIQEITAHKERVVKESPDYNKEYADIEKQFDQLEQSIEGTGKKGHISATANRKAWSTNFNLLDFARRKLEEKQIENLKDWDEVWEMNRIPYFAYGIFHIFESNISSPINRKYVVEYCKKYADGIHGFYQNDYFVHNIVSILKKIIDTAPELEQKKYLPDIFEITKIFLYSNYHEIFYLKESQYSGHREWHLKEICSLVDKLYKISNEKLKDRILIELIWSVFNLTEDEDELMQRAPAEIYSIVHDWLSRAFWKNFPIFVKKIVKQYKEYYKKYNKKKNIYQGWEHIGGTTSFGGSRYHTGDRLFVGKILEPAIQNEYKKNITKTWNFIKTKCFAGENEVSDQKPDFLNRAIYTIILSRYADKNIKISAEAFKMLKDLLSHRKGIPHKSDLIYQWVARSGILTDEKKWKIVNVSLKKWKIPINPYIEEIIQDLAKKNKEEAKNTLCGWYENEKYHQRGHIGGSMAVDTIRVFINVDLDFSIKLLRLFINSNYFITDKFDLFDTYEIARIISEITKKDPTKGIDILNSLVQNENWGRNQRSLFCFGLFNHHEKGDTDPEVIAKVYVVIVKPFLEKYNSPEKLLQRIPEDGFRSAIVQFAEILAKHKYFKEAISMVELFINDPDPYLPGKSPDPEDEKYNQHKKIEEGEDSPSITTVRGWCGWVLMTCGVSGAENEIDKMIRLIEKLVLEDQNYYVIHMGSFALHQLATNRLTYRLEDPTKLFLDSDQVKALKKAKYIEAMAFKLLRRIRQFPPKPQSVLAGSVLHVFDAIRSLNQKEALDFLNELEKFPEEVQSEAIPLYIYYAIFRTESYKKFSFALPGLYDDINPKFYDSKVFEDILEKLIKRLQNAKVKEIEGRTQSYCFKIVSNFEHLLQEEKEEGGKMEKLALHYIGLVADKYEHNTSTLIYQTILGRLEKNFDEWYALLIKELKAELTFYTEKGLLENPLPATASQYYWYPSLYNREILQKVYLLGGQERFLEVCEIIFSFPLNFELYIDGEPVELLKKIADKNEKISKTILKKLYQNNPGKWRELKKYK